MKRLSNIFFSMETMGFLIIVFAGAIGTATFIENDFGVAASKALVYKHIWFNILLVWLGANLVVNIFRYRMYRWQKITMFLFHLAFLVILIGAGITRFISYEGSMHIREGKTSNTIVSDETFVRVWLNDKTVQSYNEEKVLLSVLNPTAYSSGATIGDKKFRFQTVKYVPNAQEIITEINTEGKPYLVLVASTGMGRQSYYLEYGKTHRVGESLVNFSDNFVPDILNIRIENDKLLMKAVDTLQSMAMTGGATETFLPGEWHPFEQRKLYQAANMSIVLTDFYKNGGVDYRTYSGNDFNFMDALVINASSGDQSTNIVLRGGKGYDGKMSVFTLNGVDVQMKYGSKIIELPFSLELVDFQLERYPGSMSPSSYASEVILIDNNKNLRESHRIFMNNVLNYGGYRFFQSSYDKDELGTILSVNHDYWGTLFTYFGYFLMTLGMFLTPFNKSSRFALLGRLLKKSAPKKGIAKLIILLFMMSTTFAFGQHNSTGIDEIPEVDKAQAEQFSKLLIQSHDGRLKPINTFSSEMLRKISRKNSFNGMNPDQVLLGMLSQPMVWQQFKMIKVTDKELKQIIGINGKHASYFDFIDMSSGTYKLSKYVSAAYAKKPAQRNMFDKDVMKVDERLNICYMIYTGDLLKILPNPTDTHKSWYSPTDDIKGLSTEDSIFIKTIIPTYLNAVAHTDFQTANELVDGIDKFQRKFGAEILPPDRKRNFEISYNRMNIFNNLSRFFGLIGFVMLILAFVEIFNQRKTIKYIIKGFTILVIIGFLLQTTGLILRWYISGHAPWSNGYESLIYIGWVTMLAGLLFSRKSNLTLAATTVLTSIILMVAHLSWMDPEITNLVPVLKSYWLTIHVSIITASYGFLALGMLLGFLNLILMVIKSEKNHKGLELKIKDLTAINERALMLGLYMLTIGTFLGGVWANESWGRYWGWDPKETWALVSVLVYSFILHMHYIPGLKNNFSFNFASMIGFSAILMTYFGVNYYLSGLHSYAAGDPVPVPSFIYYTIYVVLIISSFSYINIQSKLRFSQFFFSPMGRISRKQYWVSYFLLFQLPISILSLLLDIIIGNGSYVLTFYITPIIMTYPGLIITIKRWHDRNKSGYWVLLSLIPVVGNIWTLVEIGFLKGSEGSNKYGDDPTEIHSTLEEI